MPGHHRGARRLRVLFSRADVLLKELAQARVDHTFEKTFRRFLAPDLLIVDDFGLRRLTAQQSQDLYELIIERHRRSSFAFTSNRGVDEWLGLFDDPILGNSAWTGSPMPRTRSSSKAPATAPSWPPSGGRWSPPNPLHCAPTTYDLGPAGGLMLVGEVVDRSW